MSLVRDDARAARASELFEQAFGTRADGVAVAPGRVNLIGEHTDYNEGYVLPMAIDRAVTVAFRERDDRTIRAKSTLTGDTQTVSLDALNSASRGWMAYVAGAAWAMQKNGNVVKGTDLLIHSDLPTGAGLSSSAALEVATVLALGARSPQRVTPLTVASLARRAENDFVGVACGVMDQIASACATEGSAMFLDCRTLAIQSVFIPEDVAIVAIDSGARRKLAESEYNDRRAACERVAVVLRRAVPGLLALRDATISDITVASTTIGLRDADRALHVVAENQRVLDAVDALLAGDNRTLGVLFSKSHASLRDLYEVSSPELEAVVAAATKRPGCYGARMTGAGFGGCAIALVARERAAEFVSALPFNTFVVKPARGAQVLFHE